MASEDLSERRVIPMQCRVNQSEATVIRKAIGLSSVGPVAWCRAALLSAANLTIVRSSPKPKKPKRTAKKKPKRATKKKAK